MASGKTENYGLSQWEATDQVVRGDFNADNAKIDAGMAENKAAAAAAKETAENLAAVAFTPENLPFVVGTYTGNGAASRTISLGFTPRAVFVIAANGMTLNSGNYYSQYGGLAISGSNAAINEAGITSWVAGKTAIGIVGNGFRVANDGSSNIGSFTATNSSGTNYHYIALR